MLETHQYERSFGDVTDGAWAKADMSQGAPAFGKKGTREGALAEMTAWMLPPKSWGIPEYHRSICQLVERTSFSSL
jgi:hypothetical protein